MKVFTNAFEMEYSDRVGFNISEFWDYLISKSGDEFSFGGSKRLLYVHEYSTYYACLFITIRDERTFCSLKRGEELSMSVEHLDGNADFMDFNFFVASKIEINNCKFRGLYQSYRRSCSLIRFSIFFERMFRDFYNKKMREIVNSIKIKDVVAESTAKRRAGRILRGKLKVIPLVSRSSFQELISHLSEIRSFRYEYSVYNDREGIFIPARDIVKSKIEEIRFRQGEVQRVKNAIISVVRDNPGGFSWGTVIGRGEDGREFSFKLDINKNDFGVEEFDDVTAKLPSGPLSEFYRSAIFQDLIQIITDNDDIFGDHE